MERIMIQREPKVKILDTLFSSTNSTQLYRFECTVWSMDFELIKTSLDSKQLKIVPDNKSLIEIIQEIKTNPWGPKYWIVNHEMSMQFNDYKLPASLSSNADLAWSKFAYASAQIVENFNAQLQLLPYMLEKSLYPFLPVTFNSVIPLALWGSWINTKDNPNLVYFGNLIKNAIEQDSKGLLPSKE